MEVNELVLILSVLVVVVGWFVNSHLNRKHEIAKERMNVRKDALLSFIPVFLSINTSNQPFIDDPELGEKIKSVWIKIQLFGYNDEITSFAEFRASITSGDVNKASENFNKLTVLMVSRIREEVGLSKWEHPKSDC